MAVATHRPPLRVSVVVVSTGRGNAKNKKNPNEAGSANRKDGAGPHLANTRDVDDALNIVLVSPSNSRSDTDKTTPHEGGRRKPETTTKSSVKKTKKRKKNGDRIYRGSEQRGEAERL